MKILFFLLIIILIIQGNFAQSPTGSIKWNYPVISPDTAIDLYFGQKVIDPYRNLEEIDNQKIKIWMKNQNLFYDSIIQNITYHDTIKKEILKLSKMRKSWTGYTRITNSRIFFTSGLLDESHIKLVYIDSLNKVPVELFNTIDLNTKDSCIYEFNYYEPSFNGKFIAFGISPNGSEKATIYIVDVDKKQLLSEKIENCFAGNIQWLPNNKGFFYLQQKTINSEEDKLAPYSDSKVKLHILYTDSNNDKEIFSHKLNKDLDLKQNDWFMINIFPSSNYVLMDIINEAYSIVFYANLKDLLEENDKKIEWKKIFNAEDKICNSILFGNHLFAFSFKQNPNGQLITLELPNLSSKVIYETTNSFLDDIIINNKGIYFTIIENGINKLVFLNPMNYQHNKIKLPFLGGIRLRPPFGLTTFYQSSDKLLFILAGYNKSWGDYICDENNDIINANIASEIQYIPLMEVIVEEIEIPSHDKEMVPLSIVYKKGLKLDGNNPINIEAYGAYGNIKKPEFSRNRLVWIKNGGIYAYAHVRGGGEKGDNWYMNGFKARKYNSWKDLIACAEYLVKEKYTSPDKIALTGKSAGAVTVGRAITERPDLFKAAVIYVGTFNPLRMENTVNKSTISEFGSSKDSLGFQYLINMDPYHQIKKGIKYPSVLFTAGLNDSRVPVWQSAKGAAKMQEVSKDNNIVLFRIGNFGHYSYPSDADVYSFLFWQLGHPDFKLNPSATLFKPNP